MAGAREVENSLKRANNGGKIRRQLNRSGKREVGLRKNVRGIAGYTVILEVGEDTKP